MAVSLASSFLLVSVEHSYASHSSGNVLCCLQIDRRNAPLARGLLDTIRLQDLKLLRSIQPFRGDWSISTDLLRTGKLSWKLRVPSVNASGSDQTSHAKPARRRTSRLKREKQPASSYISTPQPALCKPADLSDDGVTCPDFPELNGNPLGRKALGKEVVKWISEGMAAMAADAAGAEANMEHGELQEKIASGLSFVMQAQHFLNITPMPSGFEALCLRASTHYPTLFDHFQRELQNALGKLQEEGVIKSWKEAKAWQLLKLHAKSGSHRVIARKAPESKQLHEELGLARSKIAEIQNSIDQFVSKTVELLQIERNAELEATQSELDASPPEPKSSSAGPTEYLVYHGQSDQEQCDTICNLLAVSSSTGLGGTHIVTFRVEGGHRLPPTNISPGDMVCIRMSDRKGAGSTECIQGFVHSLGEDGASISSAIEARYGDPIFSRLFGRPIRIDRISALADPTTFEFFS